MSGRVGHDVNGWLLRVARATPHACVHIIRRRRRQRRCPVVRCPRQLTNEGASVWPDCHDCVLALQLTGWCRTVGRRRWSQRESRHSLHPHVTHRSPRTPMCSLPASQAACRCQRPAQRAAVRAAAAAGSSSRGACIVIGELYHPCRVGITQGSKRQHAKQQAPSTQHPPTARAGGGVGGCVAAAKLAQLGHSVTLLEQNDEVRHAAEAVEHTSTPLAPANHTLRAAAGRRPLPVAGGRRLPLRHGPQPAAVS